MSSPPSLRCPTCLHLSSAPVCLPCGHAFCLTCLQTIDQGLDRHYCPQCREEYHPNYYPSYDYCKDYSDMKYPGMSQFTIQNMSAVTKNVQENESIGNYQQNLIEHIEDGGMESKEDPAFQNKSPISEEDERKMAESKLKLLSEVPHLTSKLEKAEMVLKKVQAYELTVTSANANLRENALKLLGEVTSFAQNYSETIMALIEREFSPGEEIIHKKLEKASGISNEIKKTMQEVDHLLKEKNANVFKSKIQSLESEIERCEKIQQPEESHEFNFDLSKLCPELERLNCEFRDKLGQVQRSLRNKFNPSEVTFDPETLHPNLILSEDLKTVTFSAKKQLYPTTPKRFTNFIQVLSAQSFSAGVHRWKVDVDSAPWLLGVCVASSVPRSGLPSALETCPFSWALMWNQNVLNAFDRSKATQLQKTPQVSRKMELKLDCDRGQLDFYYLSETTGRRHIHTFKIETKEPLHLAYRMLSGDPKGRATICS
ncbi:hypothetical protein NQD34_003447 [Periophthalmus magnuspinnatus]|nr:hypothetical protein NQD34_003447 [Periophthalmus magnuspinnatus]